MDRREFLIRLVCGTGAIIAANSNYANADNLFNDNPDLIEFNDNVAKYLAQNFLNENGYNSKILGDPTPIINANNVLYAYYIPCIDNESVGNYIIIDATCSNFISRFNLTNTALAKPKVLSAPTVDRKYRLQDAPKAIYSDSPLAVFDQPKLYDKSFKVLSGGKIDWWTTIMVSHSEIESNSISIKNVHNLSDFTGAFFFVTDDYILQKTGKYACHVMAAYTQAGNILNNDQTAFLINLYNDTDQYVTLWNYTKTEIINNPKVDHVEKGSTTHINAAEGFCRFVREKGRSISYLHVDQPNWSSIDSHVLAGKQGTFMAGVKLENGTDSSHALAIAGTATLSSSGKGDENYIYVFDGWGELCYIPLNHKSYTFKKANFYSI